MLADIITIPTAEEPLWEVLRFNPLLNIIINICTNSIYNQMPYVESDIQNTKLM
jgi:hypothetical protein